MAKIVGLRERVFEVRDVVTPYEHVLPNDNTWLIMGLAALPKPVPSGSKIEIALGEKIDTEFSLGELMDRYARMSLCEREFIESLAAQSRLFANLIEEGIRSDDEKKYRLAEASYLNGLQSMAAAAARAASAHVLQLARCIAVVPRQRIHIDATHPLGIVDAITVRLFMLVARSIS